MPEKKVKQQSIDEAKRRIVVVHEFGEDVGVSPHRGALDSECGPCGLMFDFRGNLVLYDDSLPSQDLVRLAFEAGRRNAIR